MLALSVGVAVPAVRARAKAIPVLAEALGGSFPRPFAPTVRRTVAELDGVTGHLYAPDRPARPILLLPGAAPRGKDDPRAVRLARAVARAGRLVFVPDLDLYERRFTEEDLDRIVRAILALDRHPSAMGRPTVFGISYGGSFGLVAAADPRLEGRLAQIAVFGAYFDMVGVIQAVTTGTSLVAGRSYPWEAHPLAREILERNAAKLAPEPFRDDLRRALEGTDPAALDPAARAIYDFLSNRDPAATFRLAERLPDGAKAFLARFSPSAVADEIDAPVIALHSTADPAVPYGEAIRLHRGLPGVRLVTVGGFRHVDFGAPSSWFSAAGDLAGVWRFTSLLLEAQE